MSEEKKKRGRPKKVKEETKIETFTFIPEKTPKFIDANITISPDTFTSSPNTTTLPKVEEKIVIPDFENLHDLIEYIKSNQEIVKDQAFTVDGLITYHIGKIIESNTAYHLKKFTRINIESLTERQIEDYQDRLTSFNVFTFIEEYIKDFQNNDFKKYYDQSKNDYENLRKTTEFISKSDKVIIYKYYL